MRPTLEHLGRASRAALVLGVAAACSSGPDPVGGAEGAPAPAPTRAYITNIERVTLENSDYRRVLATDSRIQLVVMSLRPGEEIGMETHEDGDQFIRVEAGTGRIVVNGRENSISDGSAVIIPAGAAHNVINTGSTPLRLYVLYIPPEHAPGTVHRTKAEAEAAGHDD